MERSKIRGLAETQFTAACSMRGYACTCPADNDGFRFAQPILRILPARNRAPKSGVASPALAPLSSAHTTEDT